MLKNRASLRVESLDHRLVPSTVNLSGGILTISGNSTGSNILCSNQSMSASQLVVYDGSEIKNVYRLADVRKIVFNGGNANDVFTNKSPIQAEAYGWGGRDELYSEGPNSKLDGGDGNDKVSAAGAGLNEVRGGSGNDTLYGATLYVGQRGNRMFGDSGNDTIYGGFRDDLIYGGTGDDVVYADDGLDVVYGGDGNDTIDGGKGADSLFGGAGDDKLKGGTGGAADILRGDAGRDTFFTDYTWTPNGTRINRDAGQDFTNGTDLLRTV